MTEENKKNKFSTFLKALDRGVVFELHLFAFFFLLDEFLFLFLPLPSRSSSSSSSPSPSFSPTCPSPLQSSFLKICPFLLIGNNVDCTNLRRTQASGSIGRRSSTAADSAGSSIILINPKINELKFVEN